MNDVYQYMQHSPNVKEYMQVYIYLGLQRTLCVYHPHCKHDIIINVLFLSLASPIHIKQYLQQLSEAHFVVACNDNQYQELSNYVNFLKTMYKVATTRAVSRQMRGNCYRTCLQVYLTSSLHYSNQSMMDFSNNLAHNNTLTMYNIVH